ncbi:neutral/alkaline non-lysosomal ceramidase N-terminal domain-containing protein [Nannocystaceae bacterium ST9]
MQGLARSLVLAAGVILGCATSTGPGPLALAHEGSGALLAGAAKVDITPLAGMPLGAHSIEGGTGLARWTRLWARAIYVEDERGEPLVLVACDLWSIPAGLGDAVVERLHATHGIDWLDRRHLLIAATHTHHGPAAFASNRLYNRAAGPAMGFDPELHAFLADALARAIVEALHAREPATLRLERGEVGALARNRSFEPFASNPEADALLAANADLPECAADRPEACKAIDPTLTTLRIDDAQGRPIAVAAFFAVHATAMINRTDAYNGDLFAIATHHAEQALALGDREGVVALFNGAEADVSPAWQAQGRANTRELGERLGRSIVATAGIGSDCASGRAITGTITNRYRQVALADQLVEGPEHAHTAARALPGKAILGGAEDGRTRYHRRWPEGQTVERSRRAGQGPKRPAIPPGLFAFAFPSWTLVASAPVSLHRLGPLALAGVPGEFSTVMGMRIRHALRTHAEHAESIEVEPIVVGLADEYAGYFVTPQEFALQHYEGASTLWGQYAAALLASAIAGLVDEDPGVPALARFDPGQHRDFALRASDRRALVDLDRRLADQLDVEGPVAAIEFESAPPSWRGPTWPTITIEARVPDGAWQTFADDRGPAFVVFPIAVERERWRWRAWWLDAAPERMQARFRVFTSEGHELCSSAFAAGERPASEPIDCVERPRREAIADEPPGLLIR